MYMNLFVFMYEKYGYFIILLMCTLGLDMCVYNALNKIFELRQNQITYNVNILRHFD